jgi:putative PIN family toxin of toxin-antitoxin system
MQIIHTDDFRRNLDKLPKQIHRLLKIQAEAIAPSQKITVWRDPHDNKFIECAFAADADYIVSGDEDLLAIKEYGKIKIVTADTFLRILDNQSLK